MASDLERTLIAARYSSRELSKLLHGLFLPDEDPVVVVDTDPARLASLDPDILYLVGDVSDEEVLRAAGIERAEAAREADEHHAVRDDLRCDDKLLFRRRNVDVDRIWTALHEQDREE